MPRVKIGIDEWVIVSNGDTELCTDGLSGCVAIVLATDHQACMTHVFSDCDSDGAWVTYKHQLELPLGILLKRGPITYAGVACGDDRQTWLMSKILEWVKEQIGRVETHTKCGGVRLKHSFMGWEIFNKEEDNKEFYRSGNMNTANGTAHFDNFGGLSDSARPIEV